MSRYMMVVWSPGHCGLSGNELADHLVGTETQHDNTLTPATQRALIRHSCHFHPIQHMRLKEVNTSLPDEQIKTSFAMTEHTDMACFRSGHHFALCRWLGISEDDICRLCGEEVKSVEHLWLLCPALLVVWHHSDLTHMMDKLVRLPLAALALLRIILKRLR